MAKKKVIDPQPIIEQLANRCLESKGLECSILGNVIDMLKTAPDASESAPTGKWLPYDKLPGYVMCSVCEDCVTYDEWPDEDKLKYCPNCGSMMERWQKVRDGNEETAD